MLGVEKRSHFCCFSIGFPTAEVLSYVGSAFDGRVNGEATRQIIIYI
jgi:hypothetical protein